jgi:hypothetical protein
MDTCNVYVDTCIIPSQFEFNNCNIEYNIILSKTISARSICKKEKKKISMLIKRSSV